MLQNLLVDLRFGLRLMRRNPGFTLVALGTMALGIGGNVAVFSVVNGVLLQPLPYPEADRIVFLAETNPSRGWDSFSIAPLNFWDWQEQNSSMEMMAAFSRNSVVYTGGERPEMLSTYKASEDFLKILGREPVLGRGILKQDLDPEQAAVVVLSHGFWQREFGGERTVIGRDMVLDGVVHTVVGVLPQSWQPPSMSGTDLILPLRPRSFWHTNRGSHFLYGLARLKPNVSLERAQSDLTSVAAALEAQYPDTNNGWGAVVYPLDEVLLGSARPQLVIFMASVGLVLLIVCANLANMTLARTSVRRRELAVRAAVGARRGRVIQQLLAESVLLATLGGVVGIILALLGLRAFVAQWPTVLPRMQEITIDATVVLFCLALSLISGLLSGLLPALNVVGRADLLGNLRDWRVSGRSASRRWLRGGLVVVEVGMALILLVGTGLLVKSLIALEAEDPGFLEEDRLVFSTPLPQAKYSGPEERIGFGKATLERLRTMPGVESAALTSLVPLGGDDSLYGFWTENRALTGSDQADGSALFYRVSPDFLETIGIPILGGRSISSADREGGQPVVVVSQSLADRHFAGENPVGKMLRFGRDEDDVPVEIVGVAGEIQHYSLGGVSPPQVYVPFTQNPTGNIKFVVKASIPPASLVGSIREAVKAVDPDQPTVGIETLTLLVADSIVLPRLRSFLMTGFGLTALVLAVVGLYGMMAYSVSRRVTEIGVRMALGASRWSILGLVLREGLPLVGLGVTFGLVGALCLGQLLESMLFRVGAFDLFVYMTVPVLLGVVALGGMLIPARRATRVDPARILGSE
jgi:putative ABC transport system permease protein